MVNENYDLDEEYLQKIRLATVSISEIVKYEDARFEGSVYCTDGRKARKRIINLGIPLEKLDSSGKFVKSCFYPGRFKRSYVNGNVKGSYGFLGSAEMLDVRPHSIKYLFPDEKEKKELSVELEEILLSRSGTIGNVTLVNHTLSKYLISEHAIRIKCKNYPGYLFAYLKSSTGQVIIKSNTYGAVVSQIEPEHLNQIPVPNPENRLKDKINDLILKSFSLRDTSNQLLDKAQMMLIEELNLPKINDFQQEIFEDSKDLISYIIPVSKLDDRFDSSYHRPIVNSIISHLENYADRILSLGDTNLSREIILPGRFKRYYVAGEYGIKFLGGKDIFRLDPNPNKFLSNIRHREIIDKELHIEENDLLSPSRGTIGQIVLAPKHFTQFVVSDNVIIIRPSNNDIAGYLYCFLDSIYGEILIKRLVYGGVIDAVEPIHVSQVQIPLLKNKRKQKTINELVLNANKNRYEAFILEQEAIKVFNTEVLKLD